MKRYLRCVTYIKLSLSWALLVCTGCHSDDTSSQTSSAEQSAQANRETRAAIYASTWVLQHLTQELVGPQSQVRRIAPPGADPALYTPEASALIEMQRARLIVLNGAHLEEGLKSVSLPISRIVMSADNLRAQWLEYPRGFGARHHHGPEGAHSHRGVDGHTWLDPELLKRQLDAIEVRLKRTDISASPEASRRLRARLDQIDQRWQALAPRLRRVTLISNHPAYQYIARRYKLTILPLDLSPDAPPTEARRAKLTEALKGHHPPAYLLWESAPSAAVRQALGVSGVTHLTLHTLEQPVGDLDPISLYLSDLQALDRALTTQAAAIPVSDHAQ